MKEIDPHLPVNSTAAFVVSNPKHQQVEFNPGNRVQSMAPLPTKAFTGKKEHDLTGHKVGRFTVIGCSLWRPRSGRTNATRWVCRCTCGRYQLFTTKAVKNNNPDLACTECYKTHTMRERYLRIGIYDKFNQ